ncbi:MAG TPA: RNA polymerase subunit sigma-70, partial [Candidatus Yonathbacteria bacterium]|nr:RNA polymerase subunit sigma-70 [Candidatus Yonathbacteria bacterium]
MPSITFKPKQVVKRLLTPLSPRALDVMTKRYGLGESVDRMTLEGIGKTYGITRERVRQIENFALASIKKAD